MVYCSILGDLMPAPCAIAGDTQPPYELQGTHGGCSVCSLAEALCATVDQLQPQVLACNTRLIDIFASSPFPSATSYPVEMLTFPSYLGQADASPNSSAMFKHTSFGRLTMPSRTSPRHGRPLAAPSLVSASNDTDAVYAGKSADPRRDFAIKRPSANDTWVP